LELAQRSMAQNGRPIEVPAYGVAPIPGPAVVAANGAEMMRKVVSV
jgi:hypothetical protein